MKPKELEWLVKLGRGVIRNASRKYQQIKYNADRKPRDKFLKTYSLEWINVVLINTDVPTGALVWATAGYLCNLKEKLGD